MFMKFVTMFYVIVLELYIWITVLLHGDFLSGRRFDGYRYIYIFATWRFELQYICCMFLTRPFFEALKVLRSLVDCIT